jgi:arylsulfatase A-like enzyme
MHAYAERLNLGHLTDEQWREIQAVYYGMAMRVDYQVGLVVQALKEAGMYDDTAMFFFSDHGDYTGDYGLVEKHEICFEDCLTRVPFVVKPPKGTPIQPGIRDDLVELTDFSATVEAVSGLSLPHGGFGKSLLPLISGDKDVLHRDAVVSEAGRLEHETHLALAGTGGRTPKQDNPYWPKASLQGEELIHGGKATMLRTDRYKLIGRVYEADELYDLHEDPWELKNLIDDPAYAEVLQRLRERMLRFYLETDSITPPGLDKRE